MHADFSTIQPWLIAALLVFAVYRRIKRSFGRQPLLPRRMLARVALLIVIACLLAPTALRSNLMLAVVAGGLAAGVALGLWGAAHTRFLNVERKRYYVPHTYAGLAVTLLVVGRVAYRATQLFGVAHSSIASGAAMSGGTGMSGGTTGSGGLVQSPLTVGVLFVLVGYYVSFYIKVLQKSKHPRAEDLEPPAPVTPPAEVPPG